MFEYKNLRLIVLSLAFLVLVLSGCLTKPPVQQEISLTPDEAIILAKIKTYLSFIGQPVPSGYHYYSIFGTYGPRSFEDHLEIVGIEDIEISTAYEKIKEIRVLCSFRENRDAFLYWFNGYGAVAERHGFTRIDYQTGGIGYLDLKNYDRIVLEDWSRPEDKLYMGRVTFSNGY